MSQSTVATRTTAGSRRSGTKRVSYGTTTKTPKSKIARPIRIGFSKQSFPPQLKNTLKYCSESLTISTNASGLGSHIFSANGLYDPDISGVGHQPMYFDQLTAIYNHYCVLSSRITVVPDAPITWPLSLTLVLDDDVSISASAGYTVRERHGAKTITFNPAQTSVFPALKMSWKATNVFTGNPLSRLELQGDSGNNPAEQSYFHIYVDGGAAGATSSFFFKVFMEFDVVWDELVSITGS